MMQNRRTHGMAATIYRTRFGAERREESINILERKVNLILSQKSEGSHVNDQTLAKALKELECFSGRADRRL